MVESPTFRVVRIDYFFLILTMTSVKFCFIAKIQSSAWLFLVRLRTKAIRDGSRNYRRASKESGRSLEVSMRN